MKNAVGREIPSELKGRTLIPFKGARKYVPVGQRAAPKLKCTYRGHEKVGNNLREAIGKSGLKDGDTVSFHHHFRGGDKVINMVMAEMHSLGFKGLTVASSSIHPVHRPMVSMIQDGTISNIECGVTGPVGVAISKGEMEGLLTVRSHGGRARAIEAGHSHIDVAFIAAPSADNRGNVNGIKGKHACGALGYAFPDGQYADHVIAITNEIVPYPNHPISIPQHHVDQVIKIDEPIGDPEKIVTGTLKITRDPMRLLIARHCVEVIKASGLLVNGFSYQSGAGGIPLAVTDYVGKHMAKHNIKGSFGMGGATQALVDMLEAGLIETILDVQSFDVGAVKSMRNNANHVEIGSSFYASPFNAGCAVDNLDMVILGATEVDANFNVNVVTESNGMIAHGIGGHQDTSEGSQLSIIALPLIRGRLPVIKDEVICVTAPGENIDVIVTERGIAVNPNYDRYDEIQRLKGKLPIMGIEELKSKAEDLVGSKPKPVEFDDEIVAIIEHRDGTVLDVIRKLKGTT